jgi:hypothetical protein
MMLRATVQFRSTQGNMRDNIARQYCANYLCALQHNSRLRVDSLQYTFSESRSRRHFSLLHFHR